jgi:hypothetical protein
MLSQTRDEAIKNQPLARVAGRFACAMFGPTRDGRHVVFFRQTVHLIVTG